MKSVHVADFRASIESSAINQSLKELIDRFAKQKATVNMSRCDIMMPK
jgi:hypothetical protein